MTLYGFHTGVGLSPTVTGAFCRGAKAPLRHVSTFLEGGLPADAAAVAMYGILRGTGLLYRYSQERKIDFYYIDHGYFTRSTHWLERLGRSHRWFRVTMNGHATNRMTDGDNDRFRRYFANHYPLLPWRGGKGDAILILPPTPAIRWFFGCSNWREETVRRIRCFSEMPIIWREKPGAKNVDEWGNPDGTFSEPAPPADPNLTVSSGSLQDDLDRAAVVVCFNSNVAVEAIRQGIPVLCEEHCAAHPIRFPWEALASPRMLRIEPDRQTWFAHLANHQFSLSELKSGYAWEHLRSRSQTYN
ncbi:hypothetical protein [Chelativorans xinjiangense]|uniref:hypothetical protein n=1 Tax=Chelativorans xinjiangense TaxID=2681485 RepID=UPI00135A67B4|nr:hypothetical protein [Chelativorans xinjiangense]